MNITMTREQILDSIEEIEESIMWAKTEYSSYFTSEGRREEIDQDLFKDEAELKDLQEQLEWLDNPADDELESFDMDNIASVFFYWGLMTAPFESIDYSMV